MEINKKSPDLLFLEECIKNIKTKSNVQGNIDSMARVLKRLFDLKFDISIVNNDGNKFFGMNIFPTRSTMDRIINSMLNNKSKVDTVIEMWQQNDTWYLEMDSILIYDTQLNANPSEIVAVLLHEIGHIIYSNSIPQRINRVMKYTVMNLDYSVKHLIQFHRVRQLFQTVFIEACSSKNFHYTNTDVERIADQFVVKMGYGHELDNFIGKLIATQGNSSVNRPDSEMDDDVRTFVKWSIENISELEYRKTKLKQSLQNELLRNPSKYVRTVFDSIKRTFFGGDADSYKALVTEQYLINDCKKIVRESILDIFDNIGKVKKISQSDIDFLALTVEKIDNNDDKIYALDLLYDKLDLVNLALDYIGQGKQDKVSQSKQTLQGYHSQLEKLRQRVLAMQLPDKQYGIFIKYPKGYEG